MNLRIIQLENLIPLLEKDYELIPSRDVGLRSKMQLKLQELRLEYRERTGKEYQTVVPKRE